MEHVAPGSSSLKGPPVWPPEVFAIVASLLRMCAAYTKVVERWPPSKPMTWADYARGVGQAWRAAFNRRLSAPVEVGRRWRELRRRAHLSITEVADDDDLCDALLELTAFADEASVGAGLPPLSTNYDRFIAKSIDYLNRPSSNLRQVGSYPIVLPKLHTPQTGLTLRSLTHHLSLCATEDVHCDWRLLPFPRRGGSEKLNLLLLPWPRTIHADCFIPSAGRLRNMDAAFGWFACDTRQSIPTVVDRAARVFSAAEYLMGKRVDGILFPELALRDGEPQAIVKRTGAFVIGGIGRTRRRSIRENAAAFAVPLHQHHRDYQVYWEQQKHHRWCLTPTQVRQYGFGNLDERTTWWENIHVGPRRLTFWAIEPWLTIAVLICEDLARQDPISDVVRSVGPNLLISCLLDGPQLASRWSARYAAVLAEDPGCSVLTLTSAGMSSLSSPPEQAAPDRRDVIALWRDAVTNEPVEISLAPNSAGVVLSLRAERRTEWAADGRPDAEMSTYLVYESMRQVPDS